MAWTCQILDNRACRTSPSQGWASPAKLASMLFAASAKWVRMVGPFCTVSQTLLKLAYHHLLNWASPRSAPTSLNTDRLQQQLVLKDFLRTLFEEILSLDASLSSFFPMSGYRNGLLHQRCNENYECVPSSLQDRPHCSRCFWIGDHFLRKKNLSMILHSIFGRRRREVNHGHVFCDNATRAKIICWFIVKSCLPLEVVKPLAIHMHNTENISKGSQACAPYLEWWM